MQLTTLEKQLGFPREIDRLKTVVRQSPLLDKSRKENSAEHSWHLAMYALLLNEYACGPVNTNRVIQMLLLHDVVEIDVGDFPIHRGSSGELQAEQESRAAARLFGLLPQQQGNELLALWQEFEHAETEDAKREDVLVAAVPAFKRRSASARSAPSRDRESDCCMRFDHAMRCASILSSSDADHRPLPAG